MRYNLINLLHFEDFRRAIMINHKISNNNEEKNTSAVNFPNKKQEECGFYIYNLTGNITDQSHHDFQNYIYELDIKFRNYQPEHIPNIVLHIESYGGDLFAGLQIYSLIKSSRFKISTYTSYGAFSAGTLILLSGDDRYIQSTQYTLIHPFSNFAYGKYHELKSSSEWNDKIMNTYIKVICDSTRLTEKEIRDVMNNGTDAYYSQEESLQKGIVDYIGTFEGSYFDIEYSADNQGNIVDYITDTNLFESVQKQKQTHRFSKFNKNNFPSKNSIKKRKLI